MSELEIDRSPDTSRLPGVKLAGLPDNILKQIEDGARSFAEKYGVSRPTHPTTERYTLVTVDLPGGNIEAGVHRELGEPVAVLRSELRRLVQLAVDEVLGGLFMVCDDTAPRLVDALEAHIQRTWPSRPWWCEVYDESERLTQTYAPYGMPRGSSPR